MIRHSRLVPLIFLLGSLPAHAEPSCVDCEKRVTPSIVADWQQSEHSKNGIECSGVPWEERTSGADAEKGFDPHT
jgi:hypothetical protein